ncbi:hypothetical protein AWZ03_004564 [Drosophila navojoa]|uniref:Replication protein A subunit n=1 Tax=Drosophila navojoa TaxID=7232 RepID=A0A484BJT3_DRONA|nr:hypothetical protein AWZ03_004564 [Drosophila navojoa]
MNLFDKSGEIRVTAFKDQCDKFHRLIDDGNVYFITNGCIKPANKQYSQLKNDYEMTFTGETMVQLCDEDDNGGIPEIKFDLIPISQVSNMENKEAVDTIGICKEVGELQTFTSRTTNKELKKRELTLVDMSNAAVTLTLWGDEAVNFDGHVQPVILVKGSHVNEFNGEKSLNMSWGSILKINPDIPEAHRLRVWFDNGGADNIVSVWRGGASFSSELITLKDAYLRNLGSGDRLNYFQCIAIVQNVIQPNSFYKACPQMYCNKKVVDEGDGQYRCEPCGTVSPNFKYFLRVKIKISDYTSDREVICFGKIAEQLLRHTTDEVVEASENDPDRALKIFTDPNYTSYIFKLSCKKIVYEGNVMNTLTAQSMTPFNCKEYNKYLIKEINRMQNIAAS